MELVISTLLRGGILISLAFVLFGVALMFYHHPEYTHSSEALAHLKSPDYRFPTTLGGVFKSALQGQGRAVILLGVFVLFMTPVLRVAVSVFTFAWSRDWAFTIITSIVLATLVLSLVLGHET